MRSFVPELSSSVHIMTYIIENPKEILKPLLEKYSESGDIEKLISVASIIPDFSLRATNFNSFFCQAFVTR